MNLFSWIRFCTSLNSEKNKKKKLCFPQKYNLPSQDQKEPNVVGNYLIKRMDYMCMYAQLICSSLLQQPGPL